ncbi:MAG: SDR family oxidoreductase, partial [Deltaproteobacteria bacterium]|nr:SDR family oxidoreductase [Deltaproteobacteria bacterium]
AVSLAEAGADIAVADIEKISSPIQHYGTTDLGGLSSLQTSVAEISEMGRRALSIQADVTSKKDVQNMIDETVRKLGGLDILVCNAGVVSFSSIEELTEEAWDLTFAVNVKGVFLLINIASVAGKNGYPGIGHYCASKFAVVGFTNSLAKEVAADNIRVNAICPGIVRTQMWEYLAEKRKEKGESREESWQRAIKTRIPLGRPQTPEDIGKLAVYLATAENVTGQAINIDGGIELH